MELFLEKTESLEEKRGRILHQEQMKRSKKYRERESQRKREEKQIIRVKRQSKKSEKETIKTMKRGAKRISSFIMNVLERFDKSQKTSSKKKSSKDIDIMDIMMQ